jgi:hypothetical protein
MAEELPLLRDISAEYNIELPNGWQITVSPPMEKMDWWDVIVYGSLYDDHLRDMLFMRAGLDAFEAACVLTAIINNPQEVAREQERA